MQDKSLKIGEELRGYVDAEMKHAHKESCKNQMSLNDVLDLISAEITKEAKKKSDLQIEID